MFVRFLVSCLCLGFLSSAFSATNGITPTEILVGASGSYTGSSGPGGSAIRDGAQAALNAANAGGGVHGRKFKFVALDDAYDVKKTVENAEELINKQKVFALLGGNGGAGIAAIMPLLEKEKTPLLFPFAFNKIMYTPFKKNVFALTIESSEATEKFIAFLAKSRKLSKVGVFYQDDLAGTGLRDGIVKALEKHNIKILRGTSYQRTDTNFARQAKELKDAGVETLIMSSNSGPSVGMIEAARALGAKFNYVSVATTSASNVVGKLDKEQFYSYELVPLPIDDSLPIFKEFRKDMPNPNKDQESRAFLGYFAGRLFIEGVKKAGPGLTKESLVAGLEGMGSTDLGGLKIKFGADRHYAFDQPFIYKVENNKIERVDMAAAVRLGHN